MNPTPPPHQSVAVRCAIDETVFITGALLDDSYYGGLTRAERTVDQKITKLADLFLIKLATISPQEFSKLVRYRLITSQVLSHRLQCLILGLTSPTSKDVYDFLISVGDLNCLDYLPDGSAEAYLKHAKNPIDLETLTVLARHDPSILLTAIKCKQQEVAILLINKGIVDVDYVDVDVDKSTALTLACRLKMKNVALELIRTKCNVDAVDSADETALLSACTCEMMEVAMELIDAGCDIHHPSTFRCNTPLTKACDHGIEALALKLLDPKYGTHQDAILENALAHACRNKMDSVISKILAIEQSNPARMRKFGGAALSYVCDSVTTKDTAIRLIRAGCDLNYMDHYCRKTPLMKTLTCRDGIMLDVALELINDEGCDLNLVDDNWQTALMIACEGEDLVGIALKLINTGRCNINHVDGRGSSPFSLACERCDERLALALVDAGCALTSETPSPLIKACVNGMPALALKLATKCDLNSTDRRGNTALLLLCAREPEVASSLIALGCNLNQQNDEGNTALMVACINKSESTALELIAAKCDTRPVNKNGDSALLLACRYKMDPVARVLITVGNRNHSNNNKETALMWACANKMEGTASALIGTYSCLDNANKYGHTALTLACNSGMETVALSLATMYRHSIANKEQNMALEYARINGLESVVSTLS